MLKKTLIACLFLFSIFSVNGQNFSKTKEPQNKSFISLELNPTMIIVVDSVNHKVTQKQADNIKSAWIEKTLIVKDETTKKMYDNKNGVVLIYTKKDYKNEVLKEIENNNK
jgi:hypothetical protein